MENEITKSHTILKLSRHVYYIPSLKRVYIGHYNLRFECLGPAIIFQFIEIFFLQNIILPYMQNSKKVANFYPFIILLYLVSMISFAISIFEGPGYLSFNYFQKAEDKNTKRDKMKDGLLNDDLENPNENNIHENIGNILGIAITEDDIKKVSSFLMIDINSIFVKSLSFFSFFKLPQIISTHQPPFADYIISERRYVINPLVYDNLNGAWVGKKNAKLFILYRFFLSIASLMSCFLFLDILVDFVEDYCFGLFFIESLFIFLLILIKSFFQIVLCMRIINRIAFTKYNRSGSIIFENIDESMITFTPSEIFKNFKLFFGENPFYWILPIPPFHDFSDEELYSIQKKKFILS